MSLGQAVFIYVVTPLWLLAPQGLMLLRLGQTHMLLETVLWL